jgi:tetratricopeptide (TPR) repeat protein
MDKIIQLLFEEHSKNKEDVDMIFEMASVYLTKKDVQNADKQFDLILNKYPNNYEALKQKARLKLAMQQWNEAILIYGRLEANYLPEEEFYNNKAIAYIQIGNHQKALEYFDKTVQLNPNNRDAVYNRNRLRSEGVNIH